MSTLRDRLMLSTMAPFQPEGTGTGAASGAGAGGQQGSSGQGQGDAAAAAAVAPTRPEGLDDRFWDATAGVKWADVNGKLSTVPALEAFKAEQDVRLQGVGKAPADYALNLGDFKPPEGITVKFDDTNTMVKGAREWAVKHQVTKEAFGELLRVYAQDQVSEMQTFNAEVAKEKEKLGANGQARIDAVVTALKGRVGDKAMAISASMVTAAFVEAMESLLRTTAGPPPGSGGTGGEAKPDYAKMGPIEKIHYAHEMAAKKRAAA